jgi:hypothetical protein
MRRRARIIGGESRQTPALTGALTDGLALLTLKHGFGDNLGREMTMATGKPTSRIKLDWSKLLGFDQATRIERQADAARLTAPLLAKLGSKVGGKVGNKPGFQLRR